MAAASQNDAGDRPRFRVSDAVAVPLRGMLLRLKVVEGSPRMSALRKGRPLRVIAPDGDERVVTIRDFATTGGRPTQERLDTFGELDVVVSAEDGLGDDRPIEIGWYAAPD